MVFCWRQGAVFGEFLAFLFGGALKEWWVFCLLIITIDILLLLMFINHYVFFFHFC